MDWFHITMRITVMRQMAKSLKPETGRDSSSAVDGTLERIQWNLWHGNVHKTLDIIRGLTSDLDVDGEYPEQKKLRKALREFETNLDNYRDYIPNYGDRRRHNEPISTSFVESGVTQVVSKRFVKKQPMRWTKRGAHLLLQIRTKVLN